MWGAAGPVRYRLRTALHGRGCRRPRRSGPAARRPGPPTGRGRHRVRAGRAVLPIGDARPRSRTPRSPGTCRWCRWPGWSSRGTRTSTARDARLVAREVDQLAFNPWNTTEEFRPLGNLNRARRAAYEASTRPPDGHAVRGREAAVRCGRPRRRCRRRVRRCSGDPCDGIGCPAGWACSTCRCCGASCVAEPDRHRRAPPGAGARPSSRRRTSAARHRGRDPVDTDGPSPAMPVDTTSSRPPRGGGPRRAHRRASPAPHRERQHNDLSAPAMGAVGAAFGRNMPVDARAAGLPDPIAVSDELLARERFLPATVAQRARGGLDPVPGARLGQAPAVQGRRAEHQPPDARRPPLAQHGRRRGRGRHADRARTTATATRCPTGGTAPRCTASDAATATALRVPEGRGRGARLRLEDGYLPIDENGRPRPGSPTAGGWA